MECPYCETVVQNYEDFNLHVLKFHPEKTSLEDYKEIKRARIWNTSADLTAIALGGRRTDKDKVLETFKYILRNLMESGL
jgi:hypothetical protein